MASTQALIMLSFAASHDSTLITATSSCATSHPVLHYCVYSIQSAVYIPYVSTAHCKILCFIISKIIFKTFQCPDWQKKITSGALNIKNKRNNSKITTSHLQTNLKQETSQKVSARLQLFLTELGKNCMSDLTGRFCRVKTLDILKVFI